MNTYRDQRKPNDEETQDKTTPFCSTPLAHPSEISADVPDAGAIDAGKVQQKNRRSPVQGTNEGTRSRRTIESYRKQANPYLVTFAKGLYPEAGIQDPLAVLTAEDIASFPQWFAAAYIQTPWSDKNLRRVKISLAYLLKSYLTAKDLLLLRNFKPHSVSTKGTKGSSLREKDPDLAQLQGILFYLDHLKTTMGDVAAAWLRAQFVAGLRPKEWRCASYTEEGGIGILSVPNGKQNPLFDQGTGTERHLVLAGASQEIYRQALRTFFALKEELFCQYQLQKGCSRDHCFRSMYNACRVLFRQANDYVRHGEPVSLEKKNVCLYSLRDAFKADAVCLHGSAGNRTDTAALMGHGNARSQDMYAPNNRATGRRNMPLSFASEQSLARLQQLLKTTVQDEEPSGTPNPGACSQPQTEHKACSTAAVAPDNA